MFTVTKVAFTWIFVLVSLGTASAQTSSARTGERSLTENISHRRVDETVTPFDLLTLPHRVQELLKASQDRPDLRPKDAKPKPDTPHSQDADSKAENDEPLDPAPQGRGSQVRPTPSPRSRNGNGDLSPPNGDRILPTDNPEDLREIFDRVLKESQEKALKEAGESKSQEGGIRISTDTKSPLKISQETAKMITESLGKQELNTFYADFWSPLIQKAADWAEPFRGQAIKALRQLQDVAGEIQVRLPRLGSLNTPSMSLGGASAGESLKSLGMIALVIVGVAGAVILFRVRSEIQHSDAAGTPDPSLAWLPTEQIATRADFVQAVDSLALRRWGWKSRWWTHGRLADAFADLRRSDDGGAFEVADLYEFARYAPEHEPFTPGQLHRAINALREIEHA